MSNDITLVPGATGNTGRRATARLRLRGAPVRAASRSSRAPFDRFHPVGWDQVLRGVTTACVVPVPGPVHDFVARAEAAGVRRLSCSPVTAPAIGATPRSVWTRARPRTPCAARRWNGPTCAPRTSPRTSTGTPSTPRRPPALPAGAVPEPFIDLEDVADVAAAVLSEPGRHAGRVCELTGPRGPTWAEAVELISRTSGLPIVYRRISPAEYTATLVQEGWGEDEAQHLTEMFVLLERGTSARTSDDVATVPGRAPRTFEDFVLRAAAAEARRC